MEKIATAGEFGLSNLPKHPAVQEMFQKALDGSLPRSRSLRDYEPEKLNPTSLQVILLRASGMRQREIAEFMNATQGTHMTDASVSVLCKHPDAQYILPRLISYAADEITDIASKIKAYAGEGIEIAASTMRSTQDARLSTKIAFGFLDRAGYNTVQKVDIRKQEIVAPKKGIDNLAAALRETGQEIEADYVVLPERDSVEGVGSGNALVVSESPASGQDIDEPPISASPTDEPSPAKRADIDAEDVADARVIKALKEKERAA